MPRTVWSKSSRPARAGVQALSLGYPSLNPSPAAPTSRATAALSDHQRDEQQDHSGNLLHRFRGRTFETRADTTHRAQNGISTALLDDQRF